VFIPWLDKALGNITPDSEERRVLTTDETQITTGSVVHRTIHSTIIDLMVVGISTGVSRMVRRSDESTINTSLCHGMIWLCAMIIVSWSTGCGSPKGNGQPTSKLTGSVTIDGEPVKAGRLQFIPEGGGQAQPTTAEIVDGKYTVTDVPRGAVRVQFNIVKETGEMDTSTSQPFPKVVNIVPEKHRAGEQIQVSGNDKKDFALTSK
jgi:hypothetical protein